MDGIGSLVGTSKVKRQQQEIDYLKEENAGLQTEVKTLKEQMQTNEREQTKVTDKLRQELDKIYSLFPKIKELLRMENLCRHLGFGESLTKAILEMKPVGFRGKLYSSEYQRHFETEHSVAEIKPSANEPDRLKLTIDGVSDTNWFRQKYRGFQESIGIKVKQKTEVGKSRGI
jgi:FtsZ-binding cell division protein ZapB